MSEWRARFAGHLGVRSPDLPLFRHLAGSPDPVAQIELLAELGFAGVSDNFLSVRPPDEQQRIGKALVSCGLEMGSFVHDPARWNQPGWTRTDAAGRVALDEALENSLAAAERTGSRTITCICGRAADEPLVDQLRAMADNLAWAADRAGEAILCVETTHPAVAPGLLVERFNDALAVVVRAGHPRVRLNFDVGHLAMLGEDVPAAIERARGNIGMVQVADVPGRIDLGAGTLDWPAIFAGLAAMRYTGLVEIEHEPMEEGAAGETALLARLEKFRGS